MSARRRWAWYALLAGAALAALGVLDVLGTLALRRYAETLKERWSACHATVHVRSDSLHHTLAPGLRCDAQRWGPWPPHSYSLVTNSLGLRDSETRTVPLRADRYRVLFAGDGITEGLYVDYEETFTARIQARLGNDVEILNAAVDNHGPRLYLRRVESLLKQGVMFDEVVLVPSITDPYQEAIHYVFSPSGHVVTRAQARTALPAWPETRWQDSVNAHTTLVYWLGFRARALVENRERRLERRRAEYDPRAAWNRSPEYYAAHGARGLAMTSEAIDELRALLGARGIPLTIVTIPWPENIAWQERDSRFVRFWREWCAAREVPLVDLFPAFIERRDPLTAIDTLFVPADVHLNARGHAAVAEDLLAAWQPRTRTARR